MNASDSLYINRLRGASILRVVLGHLGLGWIFLPYSSYIGIFLSVLFFCSGYIFIYLFNKAPNIKSFVFQRIMGVVIPFYLIFTSAMLISYLLGYKSIDQLNPFKLFQILIVAPDLQDMPYPLGQIWYLRVLIFCTLISPIFFWGARYSKYVLLLPVFVALVLAATQTGSKVHKLFFIAGHNLFQEIVYGAYFFIGAFTYGCNWREHKVINLLLILICLLVAIVVHVVWRLDSNLTHYAYAPNLFYFPLGVVGILTVLVLVEKFEWLFSSIPALSKLLDFCSRHSYGIYLNHSFFIVFYENIFGLKDVMGSPLLAALKVILVLVSSLICAIPITYFSRLFIKTLRFKK